MFAPVTPAERPSLQATFLGKTYKDIERFSLTGSVTNVSDPFSFDLPHIEQAHAEIIAQEAHRLTPITLHLSDPLVMQGMPLPALQGVITDLTYSYGSGPGVLTVSGYDLGFLLTSCGPAWYSISGHTWHQLADALIDYSWRVPPGGRDTDWGLKGPIGIDLNRHIKAGRAGVIQAIASSTDEYVPAVQIGEGEVIRDTLSRYARLINIKQGNGSIVNVSALGHLQIFNPAQSADDPPMFQLNMTKDGRNQRISRGRLTMNGEGLYTKYVCYGSVVEPEEDANPENPNAGKFHKQVDAPDALRVNRRLTWIEGESYTGKLAQARAEWRARLAEYEAFSLVYEIGGGLSLPGPKGGWVPIVEGNNCAVVDDWIPLQGIYYIEQVVREQAPAPKGTTARLTLKKRGLLGA